MAAELHRIRELLNDGSENDPDMVMTNEAVAALAELVTLGPDGTEAFDLPRQLERHEP